MALKVASLNSGSNGNCYYIGNDADAILVDAGLSCRETEKRMHLLGLDMKMIRAIFISHEHNDHVKGLTTISNKYQLPVYITEKTARRGPWLIRHLSQSFCCGAQICIGALTVTAFSKKHDAEDPHSFIISHEGVNVGVLTDIGSACDKVVHHFRQCHAAFLETNYDEEMLQNGRYPYYLKQRISSDIGHLSNRQALELFLAHRPPHMTHLFLSHISRDNNHPDMVTQLFAAHAGAVQIIVAGRFGPTQVYDVCGAAAFESKPKQKFAETGSQLTLF